MTIEYLPNQGFIIDSKVIAWKTDRNTVRQQIAKPYKIDDKIIDVSMAFNGDERYNIHQKRDLYAFGISEKTSLFLNYNDNDTLNEIEIHDGIDILVHNVTLIIGKHISTFINKFKQSDLEILETQQGQFLLPALKLIIATSASFGGDSNVLDYFYAASNINHLIN